MSLIYNGTNVKNVKYNDTELDKIIYNGTVVFEKTTAQIWGVSGLGNSDPTLTRTFDNVGKYFMENMNTGEIMTGFDTEFNFETVVQNGNTMIKIPTFYKRFDTISNNQITAFSISKSKVNDDFVPYPCFVKQDGSGDVMPYILVSKGKATGTASKATCVSGESPLVGLTIAQMRTAARANGTGWQQFDWMVLQLLRDLFCVVFATTNSQTIFKGRTHASGAATVGGTWNISTPCGYNKTTMQNRFFGIEDVFGNVNDWCDGITFSGSTIYSTTNYNHFTDTTNNMVNSGSRATSNGYITALTYNTAQPFLNYPSEAAPGDGNQYYCDYENYYSTGNVLFVGGRWSNDANAGLWCSFGNFGDSYTNPGVGGRLVYRPI